MGRRWWLVVLGAMLAACGGSGAGGTGDAGYEVLFPEVHLDAGLDLGAPDVGVADPGFDPSAPCDEGTRRCDGDDSVAVCHDGAWGLQACSTLCAEQGVESLGCAEGECACADPRTGCSDGATKCQGADIRAACVGDAWKTTVCSVACAEEGQASLGCVEGACSCGTPPQCDAGETRCQGANTVALCVDGQWAPTSCTMQCADAGLSSAGCVEGACDCTDAPPQCEPGEAACETSTVVSRCVDGQWQATPCVDLCAASNQDSHGCLGEACQCVDKPLCYAGDTQCAGATTVATCNGASWSLSACAEACAAKGMIGDQCVGTTCACSPAPDCSAGQVICDGATELTCVGTSWVSTPCATACSEQSLVGGHCDGGACACLGDAGSGCPACLGGACAGAAQACRTSAPCAALTACLTACGDAACKSACWTANPTGLPVLSALLDCIASSCSGQCPDLPTCLQGQARCVSTNATEVCQGGSWVVSNCNETCYAQGLTSGGCAGGTCACVFEPFECQHGAVGCPTPQSRATCQYGVWGPQVSCANECSALGKISQGCAAGACVCEDPCTAGQKRCSDATILESCDVPPSWSTHNCESECTLKGLFSQGCVQAEAVADCVCLDDCGQCQYQTCPAAKTACDATNCMAWGDCDWICYINLVYCQMDGYYFCDTDYASCEASCDAKYPGGRDANTALVPCWNACQAPCTN